MLGYTSWEMFGLCCFSLFDVYPSKHIAWNSGQIKKVSKFIKIIFSHIRMHNFHFIVGAFYEILNVRL